MIKCLDLEKKKEKNKKLKAKVKLDRSFFVLVIETRPKLVPDASGILSSLGVV